MDLTAWQRICNRLLGGVFKKRARGDKELSDNLVKASMPMMPEVYLATVFVTTFVITALGIGFVALFFVPEIGVIDLWESQQDPASEAPCFEWEYWYPDLIDESNQAMDVLTTQLASSLQPSRSFSSPLEVSLSRLSLGSTTRVVPSEKPSVEVI